MNINGRQSYVTKIDQLIEHHEGIVRALRLTRDLLNGEMRQRKQNGNNDALTEALAHEAHKSAKRGPYKKKRSHDAKEHRYGKGAIAAQRQKSEKFLAHFDTKKPTLPPSRNGDMALRTALGPMVRRGYLEKKGDGYVRTAKPYIVNPSQAWKHKAPTNGHPTERERRQLSAAFLEQFDTETPKMIKSKLLSAMLRTGYLKHKGDGYVRTGKEFVVVVRG